MLKKYYILRLSENFRNSATFTDQIKYFFFYLRSIWMISSFFFFIVLRIHIKIWFNLIRPVMRWYSLKIQPCVHQCTRDETSSFVLLSSLLHRWTQGCILREWYRRTQTSLVETSNRSRKVQYICLNSALDQSLVHSVSSEFLHQTIFSSHKLTRIHDPGMGFLTNSSFTVMWAVY